MLHKKYLAPTRICMGVAIFLCAMVGAAGGVGYASEIRKAFPSPDIADLPYSAAVQAGNTIYVSGVLGLEHGGQALVPGGVTAEAEEIFSRISEVLERAGSSIEQVVKCTVLLADIDDFPEMNAVFAATFPQYAPARSTIIVPAIPLGAAVEIECNALVHVE